MDIGEVTVDRRGVSLWVLGLTGEHDLSNVSLLRAALDDACDSGRSVIVDLGECEFIDSTVIATLISARDRAPQDGGQFAVVAPDGSISQNVLTIVGVGSLLNVCDSLDHAVELLDASQALKPQQTPPSRHAMTPQD